MNSFMDVSEGRFIKLLADDHPPPECDSTTQLPLWFRSLVSLLVLTYFFVQIVTLLPTTKFRTLVTCVTQPILRESGLWQGFAVYCPNPRSKNIHISAIATFADGSAFFWEYPRMEKMPLWERVQKERQRKLGVDLIFWDDYKLLWKDAARYIARRCARNGKLPTTVTLLGHWSNIPAPDAPSMAIGSNPHVVTLFVYPVESETIK